MNRHKHSEAVLNKFVPRESDQKRRREERRRKSSYGFTRISTVGWICRREKLRRSADPITDNESNHE